MRRTVLVVEDNELNRRLFTHVLRLAEYEVIEAVDGAEALDRARRARPDLILLDMELPRVPGLEVVRRLRADRDHAPPPILAVSAFVAESTARHARAAGCIGYLPKPVSPAALLTAVADALEAHSATVEG